MKCPHCNKEIKPLNIDKFRKALRESSRKIAAGDKKEIKKTFDGLVRAGIYTPTGRLTKHYK